MKKPIFESEEEARELICNYWNYGVTLSIEKMKQNGIIRRSPVEEAEEMYKDKIKERNNFEYASKYSISQIVDRLYEAIQYQKEIIKQLEEK